MTYDARNLKHDDIIDALSYAVAACASALAADETEFVSASRFTAEELLRMPLRRRVLNEEELEAFIGESRGRIRVPNEAGAGPGGSDNLDQPRTPHCQNGSLRGLPPSLRREDEGRSPPYRPAHPLPGPEALTPHPSAEAPGRAVRCGLRLNTFTRPRTAMGR